MLQETFRGKLWRLLISFSNPLTPYGYETEPKMNAATVQVLMEGRKKILVTSGKVATCLNIEDSVGTILAALVRFRTSLSVFGHFVLF